MPYFFIFNLEVFRISRSGKTNYSINGAGYYRIRKNVGYNSKGEPIRKVFYGKNKKEAEDKVLEYMMSLENGLNPDLALSTLSEAMYAWIWNIERHSGNKSSTFTRYESIYRNYFQDSGLGYIRLEDLKKIPIQRYYSDLLEKGKGYAAIQNANKLLNKFLRYAVDEGYITRNPLKGLKIPKKDEQELEKTNKIETFKPEEIKTLVNSIGNEKLRYLVLFAFYTGARKGEILALNKEDIKEDYVVINKNVRRTKIFDSKESYHYEIRVTRPKSETSNRKIPLPSALKTELKKLNILVKEEKLKMGSAYTDNGLLFPSLTGNYIDASTLMKSWKRALKRAEISYRTFHALRHTYATLLLEKNAPLIEVSRLLGHSTVKTTEIYAHPSLEAKKKTIEKLDEILQ